MKLTWTRSLVLHHMTVMTLLLSLTAKCSVSANARSQRGSLVDRGANGGIIGNDAIVFHIHAREVDATGTCNHELNALKLVDASAKSFTNRGPVVLILCQCACHGLHCTVHSFGQIEPHQNNVDDHSVRVGGRQCIITGDGYVIPLDIINGLPCLKMQPNTEREFHELPHVILTGGHEWDPEALDHTLSDKDDWFDTIQDLDAKLLKTPFDVCGNYLNRTPDTDVAGPIAATTAPIIVPDPLNVQTSEVNICDSRGMHEVFFAATHLNRVHCSEHMHLAAFEHDTVVPKATDITVTDPLLQTALIKAVTSAKTPTVPPVEVKPKKIDCNALKPHFLHVNVDKIRKTFQRTTQHATNVMSGHHIQQTIQSPCPTHNVWRCNEAVASDVIHSETAAVQTNGMKMAQIFSWSEIACH